jgi:predicted Zn-dependent protease with MMP-like domain
LRSRGPGVGGEGWLGQWTTYGWRRAHKHTDTPEENAIVDQIIQGVLNEVCEYFDFDDEDCPA